MIIGMQISHCVPQTKFQTHMHARHSPRQPHESAYEVEAVLRRYESERFQTIDALLHGCVVVVALLHHKATATLTAVKPRHRFLRHLVVEASELVRW